MQPAESRLIRKVSPVLHIHVEQIGEVEFSGDEQRLVACYLPLLPWLATFDTAEPAHPQSTAESEGTSRAQDPA